MGRNPKQAVVENLRHFKALAEAGEIPKTEGQPHGDRGMVGDEGDDVWGDDPYASGLESNRELDVASEEI